MQRANPVLDIVFSVFLITVCGVVLWEARRIPPGVFDPLGSGAIPRATAWILIAMCLAVLVQALFRLWLSRHTPPKSLPATDEAPDRASAVLMTGALTIIYVLVLQNRLASFALVTTLFITALVLVLARLERRAFVLAPILGATTGFGCQYVFTQIFVVDLPTG